MDVLYLLFIFIFGLAVGSFLNCVIYRLELKELSSSKRELSSLIKGRSFCPHCKHILGFWDLIPVFSFLFLKGKCRYCRKKISSQYPIVEISTGLIFLLIFNFQFSIFNQLQPFGESLASLDPAIFNFQFLLSICFLFFVSCFLIVIFVFDLKHFIIPDKVIYPAIAIIFLYRLFGIFEFGIWKLFRISDFGFRIFNPIFAGLAAGAFFLLIVLISRGRWMGVGDIKLAFFMGLFLGFPNILVALFFAFLIGAIIGVGLISAKKKTLKSEVPFGPFLVTGTFIALFWGEKIIFWYLTLIGF